MRHPPFAVLTAAALAAAGLPSQQVVPLRQGNPATYADEQGGIVADIDGNGTVDVLLRRGAVLLGDGQGGFAYSPPGDRIPVLPGIPLPSQFQVAADVTGDGRLDLVRSHLNEIRVLPGLPGGFWSPETAAGTVLPSGAPFAVPAAAFDVDGDGRRDLLVDAFPGFGLLRNVGGTFVDVSVGSLPPNRSGRFADSADVDGDGDLDFVVGITAPLALFSNNGAGGFVTATGSGLPALANPPAVRFGDVDGDGDVDLLVAPPAGPMQLFRNGGTGNFTAISTALPPFGHGLLFTDLDGDADADLLLASDGQLSAQLQAWRNVGGVFVAQPPTTTGLGPMRDPVVVDIDADGDLDALVGGAHVFVDEGNQRYSPLQRQSLPMPVGSSVAAGDLDGDGSPDIVVGAAILRNRGDGYQLPTARTLPSGAAARVLFDMDGDGDLDVAFTDANGQAGGGVAENQGGTLAPVPGFPAADVAGEVVAADFDGDGRPDLISRLGLVLRNLGGGSFASVATGMPAVGPLAVADVDSDGALDVLRPIGNSWAVWRNVGGLTFQQQPAVQGFGTALAPRCFAAGDIDGDGDTDVVIGFQGSSFGGSFAGLMPWLQQAGTFTPGTPIYGALPLGGQQAALADLDEDGDLDLVGTHVGINDGAGVFALQTALQHDLAQVVDIDRDGDLDVVAPVGVHTNRHRHLAAPSVPVLGRVYRLEAAVRPGYGSGGDLVWPVAAFARLMQPVAVPGVGLLQVDPAGAVSGPLLTTSGSGEAALVFTIPNLSVLAGIDLFWQALFAEPAGLRLSACLQERLVP